MTPFDGKTQYLQIFLRLLLSGVTVPFMEKLGVLGVTLNSHLFDEHITGVVRACNYRMRALICGASALLSTRIRNTVVCFIVCTRLDYCDSVFYGISNSKKIASSVFKTNWFALYAAPYRSHDILLNSYYTDCRLHKAHHVHDCNANI